MAKVVSAPFDKAVVDEVGSPAVTSEGSVSLADAAKAVSDMSFPVTLGQPRNNGISS